MESHASHFQGTFGSPKALFLGSMWTQQRVAAQVWPCQPEHTPNVQLMLAEWRLCTEAGLCQPPSGKKESHSLSYRSLKTLTLKLQ